MALGRGLAVGAGDGHHRRGHPGQPGGGILHEVGGQPVLQGRSDQTGQVDHQRHGQTRATTASGAARPVTRPTTTTTTSTAPPTPPPACAGRRVQARGEVRPAEREAEWTPGHHARRRPPRPPATTVTPRPRPRPITSRRRLTGVDPPPATGEPGHRSGQVVLALGHPEPPEAGGHTGGHAAGHGDPGQAVMEPGQVHRR